MYLFASSMTSATETPYTTSKDRDEVATMGGGPAPVASAIMDSTPLDDVSTRLMSASHDPEQAGVVATFDIEKQVLQDYHFQSFYKNLLGIPAMLILGQLSIMVDLGILILFYYMVAILFAIVARGDYKKWRASCGNMMLVITPTSVRYEQDARKISIEIPLDNIVSCMATETTFRKYPWSSEAVLRTVVIQLSGSPYPKMYSGLKDAQSFVRMVLSKSSGDQDARTKDLH